MGLDAIRARILSASNDFAADASQRQILRDGLDLLTEVERLQKRDEDAQRYWQLYERYQEMVNHCEEENKRLRAALSKYADLDNWSEHGETDFEQQTWWRGGGQGPDLARAALEPQP